MHATRGRAQGATATPGSRRSTTSSSPAISCTSTARPVDSARVIVLKRRRPTRSPSARRVSPRRRATGGARSAAGSQRTDRAVAVPPRRLEHGRRDLRRVPPDETARGAGLRPDRSPPRRAVRRPRLGDRAGGWSGAARRGSGDRHDRRWTRSSVSTSSTVRRGSSRGCSTSISRVSWSSSVCTSRPTRAASRRCSIGGNVANNSGGPHCLAEGVTASHVLAVEVVLPDGTLTMLGGEDPEPRATTCAGRSSAARACSASPPRCASSSRRTRRRCARC